MTTDISNTDDVIDSREVIARIAELKSTLDDDDLTEAERDEAKAELTILEALAEQGEGYSDWSHGATLIRDSHFVKYAQELADDIGSINSDASWPYTCIDWDRAADELKQDYTSIDFDGVDYWIR